MTTERQERERVEAAVRQANALETDVNQWDDAVFESGQEARTARAKLRNRRYIFWAIAVCAWVNTVVAAASAVAWIVTGDGGWMAGTFGIGIVAAFVLWITFGENSLSTAVQEALVNWENADRKVTKNTRIRQSYQDKLFRAQAEAGIFDVGS